MEVLGLAFVATDTFAREAQRGFFRDVLGLRLEPVAGVEADFFRLPDGSVAAVYPGDTEERSVGFLVDDVDAAVAELRSAGIETDEVVDAGPWRYAHFRAPDGKRYEVVQETTGTES